ncbi:probable splicing factor 3A subunit 1 [Hordeum vulgare subsp. vulgare]|uniref:Splicing factor 3A subunit 1 n=1 Tax=Hordeum vulgare subsp. vulgare TaxID=112509 RepID=A0A287MPL4_HORVV|nr:probable splicing factor 3A subunit 1 [Hordeum vulgare subsp. vulgare]
MGSPTVAPPLLPAEGDANGDHERQQQLQIVPSSAAPSAAAPSKPPEPAPTVATHTRTIGIIHPPPDIRVIIEKTASFVAKNGPEFERRIVALNQGNAKFNFLQPSDPYHAYYQHRVSEIADAPPASSDAADPDALPSDDSAATADGAPAADHSAPFRVAPPAKVLVPPKAELYTVHLPEGITTEEVDIVKLTAQFVARNGKAFLSSLAARESTNPQFNFLRPTHSMFPLFTALADIYSRVMRPDEGVSALMRELKEGSKDLTTVLERCLNRLEWDRTQEQAKQQAEDEVEMERMQMSMIDWHDFVVVETIEFADDEFEGLPVPPTLEELKRRKRMETLGEEEPMELAEPAKDVEMEMDEEEMQLVEEGMKAARLDENDGGAQVKVAGNDEEPPMRIVKNYKRPEERIPAERDPTKVVVSPITGELIPISEMEEHMRISLIDPKYKEQKERMLAKIKETTLAPDDEISRNIIGLARTRPDIFGTTEEEVSNAVKAEIEKKKDEQPKQVIWDGHSGSIGWTATQAMSIGGEEQGDASNAPGPAPLPRPGMPLPRPPQPLSLVNVPRFTPNPMPYHVQPPHHMQGVPPHMMSNMHPPLPPGQQHMIRMSGPMGHMPNSIPPPPPGHNTQFIPGPPRFPMPPPPHMQNMPTMVNPIGIPQPPPPLPPQPPAEEQPPLPEEPEPKRQRTDDASLIPAEQFLAQHPGPARISVSVPNLDEGNLRGQVLEISVQSLSDTIGSLKEQVAGELQLPANKQKLSVRTSFLKDNLSLAYYNVGPGVVINLALRERGGRKK